MSDKKWGFFPFDATDYKAAQAYLDKKSEQGWVLDKIYLRRLARFIPAEKRYHCVDLDLNTEFHVETKDDYLQLCEDAGWELVKNNPGLFIFRSKLGAHPSPVQSDTVMEAERFWKKYTRKNLLTHLILLLIFIPLYILLFSIGDGVFKFSEYLGKNSFLLLLFLLLYGVANLIRSLVYTIRVYAVFRCKRTMPPSRKHAWAFGLLSSLAAVLLIAWWGLDLAEDVGLGQTVDVAWSHYSDEYTATPELCQSYPVITAADLGLPYSEDSRYLDGRRSILVDSLDYSEITDGKEGAAHILTTERYECVNETVARWLFASRRSETAHRHGFTWGELEWGEVTSDYGFDQICTARDNSYLLLQEGDTVALVGATEFDLTQPEQLETLWERLDLDT